VDGRVQQIDANRNFEMNTYDPAFCMPMHQSTAEVECVLSGSKDSVFGYGAASAKVSMHVYDPCS